MLKTSNMFSTIDLCALCHTNSKNRTSILSIDNDGVLIEEKLKFFLFELVHDKLVVSKHICLHCLENLNFVYKFKQMCLRNILKFNNGIHRLGSSQKPNINFQVTLTNQTRVQTPQEQNEVETRNKNTTVATLNLIQIQNPNDLKTTVDSKAVNEFKNAENNVVGTDKSKSPEMQEKNTALDTEILDVGCLLNVEKEIEIETTPDIYLGRNILPKPVKIAPKVILPKDALQNKTTQPQGIVILLPPIKPKQKTPNHVFHKCNVCDKMFDNPNVLKRHLVTHTTEKPFKCEICDKNFGYSSSLAEHKRLHTMGKPFKCDLCGTAFSKKGNLTVHRRIHTGELPYKCTFCEKAAKHLSELKVHVRTHHTKEKICICEVCNMSLSSRISLRNHIRVKHTLDKPFSCNLCGKCFPSKNNLRQHRVSHIRNKSFVCNMCTCRFKNIIGLKLHLANVHKIKKLRKKDRGSNIKSELVHTNENLTADVVI